MWKAWAMPRICKLSEYARVNITQVRAISEAVVAEAMTD